jgi:predicted permease
MSFFWKRKECELQQEVAHHLHQLAAEYQRQRYSREDALRLADREFGGATSVKERCRDERQWAWMNGVAQDIVFGWRMMRRNPVIAAAAVISLALGIGANTAIVSLMDVVLWRDLPVQNPKQLTLVHWKGHGFPQDLADGASGRMASVGGWDVADFFSYRGFTEMRKSVSTLASVAAFSHADQVSVSFAGQPTVARERAVSGNFLSTLAVRPQFGRLLSDNDDAYAAPAVAVVSHRFWERALGSDPSAVGRAMTIDGATFLIAGVLEPGFYGLSPGDAVEIYTPLHHASFLRSRWIQSPLENQRYWGMQLLARRFAGTEEARLQPALDAAFRASWVQAPKDPAAAPRIGLDGGRRGLGFLREEFRNPLLVLGGLVSLLLAIACVNIANLSLARAIARRSELAMRISLGCGRARLMRQFLTESALLAIMGGTASIGMAWATAALLGQFLAGRETLPIAFVPDGRTLAITGVITAAALLLFGLFPAWQASRRLDSSWLRQGARHGGVLSRRGWNSVRLCATLQMALSVALVLTAVIFTRNLVAIQSSDPGFDRRNLILFGTRPGASGYDQARLAQFYFNLEQRLQATPGVSTAGLASMRPLDDAGWWETVRIAGEPNRYNVSVNGVTPSYLPLYTSGTIAGRNFTRADLAGPPSVAIVSADLARRMGGNSVLGRRLAMVDGPPGVQPPEYQIVGIAPAVAATSLKDRPYAVWLPFTNPPEATVVLRTSQPPQAVLPAIRQTMSELDRNLPMVDTITMEEQISKGLQRERMFATLCNGFGILALVLSMVGLYGVISYSASLRRGEIGVRLALGATPQNVVSLILREGLGMAVLGILLGVPFVWLGGEYIQKELTGMKPLDPLSLVLSLGVLLLAALFAAGLPALRASSLDPAETLRQE